MTTVTIEEPLDGGTSPNNYLGYIEWDDGTETKVVIKGRRPREAVSASYREALFYSRIGPMISSTVHIPQTYLAVADVSNGDSLILEEFLTGYASLDDVYQHYATNTLDVLGINPDDFDIVQTDD